MVDYVSSMTDAFLIKIFNEILENEPNNYRYIDELYKPYFKDNINRFIKNPVEILHEKRVGFLCCLMV